MAMTQTPTNELLLTFQDGEGLHATVRYYLPTTETDPDGGVALDLKNKTKAISNAGLVANELIIRATDAAPGVFSPDPYASIKDKALFIFTCADGTFVRLNLPGFNDTYLEANQTHVKLADPVVKAFTDAMKANAVNNDGRAITGVTTAYRRRPRNLRKQL